MMNRNIAVVGLGYVGLPVAVSFGVTQEVIGFDINENRIEELKRHYDRTNEVTTDKLKITKINFTSNRDELSKADFIIVAVPTPINENKQPDLTPLIKASETVGSVLKEGTIVVYESTVFPGATMDKCVPVLEEFSNLKSGEDFFVGYSPERINPGDKIHTFETITKVVSGQTPEVLDVIAKVYSSVVKAGVHKAPTIEVAEAAKVIENTQRDVNIALMNELALIFDKAGINTKDVLEAAGTKWNFLKFSPGLVGGHCIGVDPYYLTHKAQELGYHPEIILSGRRINDGMGAFIASTVIKEMLKKGLNMNNSNINILGLTFKENTPDLRNTRVIDIIKELEEYQLKVNINDILADKNEAKNFYNLDLIDIEEMEMSEVLILAVPHEDYVIDKKKYLEKLNENGILIDIKGIFSKEDIKENQTLWSL
ncbi:UDP-N-acetyl-D-galactosamine dehydrogenase [Lacicoccus alkaliphilus]|uniref:UDP-N-acetyl-D-galactosamine dehydrogenase n=2 Tax=Lacicoccus TaxID=3076172 RepID=A0A1M7FX75_9BACL|nr:UDP-N-acetyl-D-galactosamine dehydrogenase [Salinicoccus alkaliphilus DSM 16010]